jgi:ribosomal-protein-alanine N-acetyltransferase
MRSDLQIIPAAKEHLEAVTELEKTIFTLPWSYESFSSELENEDSHFTVAMRDGEVIGFSVLRSFFDEGEIFNIAVSPIHRGTGIGDALLTDAMAYADTHGIGTVFLEVRRSNDPAIALYKKHGFIPLAIRKDYYDAPKEDAMIMRRITNNNERKHN